LAEFTGERLIPGQVGVDLLNEHMARYAFATSLARGKRVLDAGCGAGYGAAELAEVAGWVVGADIAAEAIDFARQNYRRHNLLFERACCAALPHRPGSFDLVVAFEVIEHLANWRELVLEARRLLAPGGQFVVSTPNRLYYNESRGQQGPNPFHVHEFEFREFRAELETVFPQVLLYLENHVEGVTFEPCEPYDTVEARIGRGQPAPDEAHFFVAVCGERLKPENAAHVYIPRAANVLRERGRHIQLLEEEIATKNNWLDRAVREHEELVAAYRRQTEELERSNRWAEALNQEVEQRRARVTALQDELADQQESARRMAEGYQAKVAELEKDIREKVQWAMNLKQVLHQTETELEERRAWALGLDEAKRHLEQQLAMVRGSRWVRLGRKFGLGPGLPAS
jgi:SAM-dependent methyltransferase